MSMIKSIYGKAKDTGILNLIDDKTYTKIKYRLKMGRKLNLNNPTTYTEKLNWLKLYDHDPAYVPLVDKWEVVPYIEKRIGGGYTIPKYGIYNSFDEIDWDVLPDQFVLKCTHDSGGVVICRDKKNIDYESARKVLETSMKRNYYWHNREWPYKQVQPRILCEQYLSDESGDGLLDYKFFCFDGKPQFMFIATGRAKQETCFDFFDMDFNWIPVKQHYPNANVRPTKPEKWGEMVDLSTKLSDGFKHVRIDFFQSSGKVYFGEMTFTHFGGFEKFEPEEYDAKFGKYLNL